MSRKCSRSKSRLMALLLLRGGRRRAGSTPSTAISCATCRRSAWRRAPGWRLVLIGVGSETGMHTPGFTDLVQRTPEGSSYVVELFPGMAKVVGMHAGARTLTPLGPVLWGQA